MKKILTLLVVSIISTWCWAQVTTNPTFITQTGGSFDIIFDASAGSAGLKGLTTGIYAHIGVITSKSSSSSDWKYVLTSWPTSATDTKANTTKNMLTNIGTNLWRLSIGPNIQSFLGVPSDESIKQIALVFRNADGSKTGKTASGGDIFVNVYQSGLNVAFVSPAADGTITAGTNLTLKANSSVAAALQISVNGTVIKSSTADSTSLTTSYAFNAASDYTLIASATVSNTTVYDTAYICVPAPVTTAARPAGLKDGINYIDNSTATLILYAPGKSNVFVIGDFNNWTQLNAYQLNKDGDYWWITLTGLTPGKMYAFQYLVDGTLKSSDPYTELVLDPWNDQWINQYYSIFPNLKPYPVGKTDGLVATLQTAKTAYNWEIPSFNMPSRENVVIYELLLRDFTKEKSLEAAIAKLDYLKNLGITAVELMPIQEFDGNNSWGYNPNHYFAPDKAYGTPDMYKKFIDECHKRGMGVILDMVFNQASGTCPLALLYWDSANSRPAANNPYMNVTAPHPYSVYNDFNHSSTATKEYFKRVMQYWITEYKVDGYRMDLAKGFTQNVTTGEPAISNYDQSRVNNLTDYYNAAKSAKGDVMFILEFLGYGSNSDGNAEENKYASEGMYLWRNMNNAFSQSAMGYQSSSDFGGLVASPRNWVGYAESHDEERNFNKAKLYGNGTIATDSVTRISRVPLNIAFTTLVPGPKMIYEFGEMGYDYSINSNGGRTNEKQPAWGWLSLPQRKAAADASAKIITLRKMYPTAFTQGNFSYNIGINDWTSGRRIGLTHADLNMVVLGNFNTVAATAYPAFPSTGVWYNLLTGQPYAVSNPYAPITMQPGDLLVFTDRQINLPNAVSNPVADTDCKVYPTTTNGKVFITSSTAVRNTELYNLQGSLIKAVNNSNEMDVTNLSNGLYLLEVNTLQGKSIHKIIKQ
ncbi:MAG: alpha-amylase family glycosyl hydrolase [Paludibacter sp.]|nr:alpha-amylase family glycosyl hydrolase [Paludibacter sp.]